MKNIKIIVSIVFSIAALLLFLVLYGLEITNTWKAKTSPKDPIDTPIAYVATSVAGLVIAIVATALGLPTPKSSRSSSGQVPAHRSKTALLLERVGSTIAGTDEERDWKTLLATLYIIVYLLIGLAAVITWVIKVEFASSLIKTQALTFLGMMLAAVKGFLTFDET